MCILLGQLSVRSKLRSLNLIIQKLLKFLLYYLLSIFNKWLYIAFIVSI